MSSPEFDQARHDEVVEEGYRRIARVALFDELIDMHHDGLCTFDQAVEQYRHDADRMEEGES